MSVAANQLISRQDGQRLNFPVEEATRLYQGTLAFVNAAGYGVPDTGSGLNEFGGVVVEEVDNSGGADGDKRVETLADGVFVLVGSGFSQASVERDAFASDNYTIADAPIAGSVRIGRIVEYLSSTKVRVAIETKNKPAGFAATVTKTADYTVTPKDLGKVLSNVGASGTITFALPAALPGMEVLARVGVAQQLRLDPNGTETISLPSTGVPGAAGKYLVADAIGETVWLKCVVAGTWSVFGYTGTWTAEA